MGQDSAALSGRVISPRDPPCQRLSSTILTSPNRFSQQGKSRY